MNRDIDNEAQGLAAEAAARQNTGRGGGGASAQPVEVRIDWSGIARRARRITVPGTAIGGLTPAPEGHTIALTLATGGGRRTRRGPGGGSERGHLPHQRRERAVDARAASPRSRMRAPAAAAGVAAPAASAPAAAWCSRRTAARSTSVPATASTRRRSPAGGSRRRPGRGGVAAAAAVDAAAAVAAQRRQPRPTRRRPTTQTARQVTYTANLEVDHKALRAQVFNEGWRIMKNRFYDAKMHGADWNAAWETYGSAARPPRRRRRAAHRHDDDDRPAQRVAHRRQRRPGIRSSGRSRRAIRASTSSPTRRASTRSATSTRTAPPIATT